MSEEIYVSVDIEADGPIPGPNSMISLGAAAFQRGGERPIATFIANLEPLDGATQHPDTMAWWKRFPEAWAKATHEPRSPSDAMHDFDAWVGALPGKPVLVVYPSWDAMWVHWYLIRFCNRSPFGIAALDIKSLAHAALGTPRFRDTSKKAMPGAWFEGTPPHDHTALNDAIGQGMVLGHALRALDADRK